MLLHQLHNGLLCIIRQCQSTRMFHVFLPLCQTNERKQKLGLTPKRMSFLGVKSFLSFLQFEICRQGFLRPCARVADLQTIQARMKILTFFLHYSVATRWGQLLRIKVSVGLGITGLSITSIFA